MSDPADIERLRRLLGTPDTTWLLERVRRRLASTGEVRGTVTLQHATVDERRALARILGRPVRAGQSATVSLELLDTVLRRAAWPDGLASAVVALAGPVSDPALRHAKREAWQHANDRMRAIGDTHPTAADWAVSAVRAGLLKRAAATPEAAEYLVAQLTLLADSLPTHGEVLGVVAARLFGDAHTLDAKAVLGPLATGLAAALGGTDTGASAYSRRQAWQAVGVVVDELSSFVLTHRLPGGGESATERALAELAATGQPAILSYRQLAMDGCGVAPPVVFVCENPAVVASAADRLGAGSAPLVCVGGQPGAAAVWLLEDLSARGSRLLYHGDFDAGGMAIARVLASRVPWQPWRFTADDYEDACASLSGLGTFTGSPGETVWDPGLATALEHHRLRVEEESVLEGLLTDLGSPAALPRFLPELGVVKRRH
ncbi:MAG: TIGR02679 family protein [Microbacteriaceae bacterium]